MSKQASSITSTNSDSNALNGFKKRQCHLICKWLPFSSFHHQFLESFHKYLRFCDLCKELAFGSPDALRQNQDFIQLVRAQNVLPPVPGEPDLPKILLFLRRSPAASLECFRGSVRISHGGVRNAGLANGPIRSGKSLGLS